MEQMYKYARTSFVNINEEVILGTYTWNLWKLLLGPIEESIALKTIAALFPKQQQQQKQQSN